MTNPICTRVTPESLPDLLRRLEDETGVRWCTSRSKPTSYSKPDFKYLVIGDSYPYPSLAASFKQYPQYTLVTPNKFIELVKAAVPKGD